jgi:hypothetical protein
VVAGHRLFVFAHAGFILLNTRLDVTPTAGAPGAQVCGHVRARVKTASGVFGNYASETRPLLRNVRGSHRLLEHRDQRVCDVRRGIGGVEEVS